MRLVADTGVAPDALLLKGKRVSMGLHLVQLRQQAGETKRFVHPHVENATFDVGPSLGRTVPVNLDAVAIRIVEIDRLGDAVIGCATDAHAVVRDTLIGPRERLPVGIGEGDVKETGVPGWRGRPAETLLGVKRYFLRFADHREE